MNDEDGLYYYHPLENIEDVDLFYDAVERKNLTKSISEERPYTYWTIELYDQANGIRGGGGLGVLAADTRRIAETLDVPFVLLTIFYPTEFSQLMKDGAIVDERHSVDYRDFGFRRIDTVIVRCNDCLCPLDVIEKQFKHTRILAVTEPNIGELYADTSGSDHRLYQEVALGFGGYAALKLVGLKPAIIQLNEVATFFAALARLDELVSNGMDFYEAVVYTRKHTLYTNHTLVQAAEAEFSIEQFERYVMPNLKSLAVKKWLRDNFENGKIKLSAITIEIAELRSGVSKLHARVANYHDLAGNKVKFKAITNGIDLATWTLPSILEFYKSSGELTSDLTLTDDYQHNLDYLTADDIRDFKLEGRELLNSVLKNYPDQYGNILEFKSDDFIFDFKRRFVDYKRPGLPFRDLERLKRILKNRDAHYILTGRVHQGDSKMYGLLKFLLKQIDNDTFLRSHVHYLANYDEKLAYGLSCGSNVAINVPIVGLEACGTSWMKDIANLNMLISTHDGGVADGSINAYLNVSGSDENAEIDALYRRMEEAIEIWDNDFDLEDLIHRQLASFLPVISGNRMLQDYIDYLFSK
ncbi:glycogen/starch/alpha-glucan phosphorylase [Candidatus Saccharibacteria bacterium]|nr:glycogen/starch/alpha-glucan phosphorylase [Candidatus Saccharibacteria bacterium]